MLSRDAAVRPFNRGDYVVGAPTPPRYGRGLAPAEGEAYFQTAPVDVPDEAVAELRATGAEVLTGRDDAVLNTRDWWAGSMIGETGGRPATPHAVVVKVTEAAQVGEVVRIAAARRIPVTPSAGRSNVTGAALPVRGGIVLDLCGLDRILDYDEKSQVVEVEAGVFGDVFEAAIQERYGVTLGHWPSSYAISTIGGWIACRGAGQLSTRYGKIEDMVLGLDVVLPDGREVSSADTSAPRSAPT
ncbi:FAD-binding oxidoreductase [Nocardiopsis composta]